MEQMCGDLSDLEFGGQNQIVNQQEQNREVNPGGLTQTDSEETLYGPKEEKKENADVVADNNPDEDIPENEEITPEIETPRKRALQPLA